MPPRRVLLSLFALLPACGNTPAPVTDGGSDAAIGDLAARPARRLTLLHSNDEHSHVFAFGPEIDDYPPANTPGMGKLKGGVARRQVVLTRERALAKEQGVDTLTVSAGDNTMGTLAQLGFSEGSDFAMMKRLGYDIGCLGNHEFDFGPAALAQSISAAIAKGGAPQFVSSNIHFDADKKEDDGLAALYGEGGEAKPIKRYHIVTTPSGLRVGFFGVMGVSAAYYAPFKVPVRFSGKLDEESKYDVVFPKLYADLQPTVDKLRNDEKVDLVVALSHGGVDLDKPENGDDYLIARNVPGIDVIISGHTHTVVDKPIVVKNDKAGKSVFIVQAGAYGRFVGRLALTVAGDGAVSFDAATSQLLPVDDTLLPDPAFKPALDSIVNNLESLRPMGGGSFLERALGRSTGLKLMDDGAKSGDLYFYKLGATDYDIAGLKSYVETNLLNLSSDAQLWAARQIFPNNDPIDLSIQAAGVIRADLLKGKSGAVSFADAFRTFPLGFSPYDNGSVGYPLVHAWLYLVEVKGALEVGASLGLTSNDSFFLGAAGVRSTVDTSRPLFDGNDFNNRAKGRIVKLEWNSKRDGSESYDTVLFDATRQAMWSDGKFGALSLFHITTNLYIASFATSNGVTLKNKDGFPLDLKDAIIKRPDGSEVKDYEAFAGYVYSLAKQNGGTLPVRYDAANAAGKVPRRFLCTGPLCGK